MFGISSIAATFSIATRGSQYPFCFCARHNSASTAEACRPGGYFAISRSTHALFSGVNSKFVGCSSARRRTDIGQTFLECSVMLKRSRRPRSPIDLAEHNVERAEDCADVGQHVLAAEKIHRLKMREAGCAKFDAVWLVRTVGHQINAELALGRFNCGVNLTSRHLIALGVELEMVDQRLHGPFHFSPSGRRDFAVVRHHGPFAARRVQLLAALSHDLYRLAHLFHADHIAIVAVAVLADGNIEIHLLVAFVGLRLAQVPWRPGAAHHDAREAPRPGVRQLDNADVDIALLEDAVARKQNLHIVADLEEGITKGLNVVDKFARQILVDAAGAEVGRVHARTAGAFVEDHQLLALLETPENRRQRADVHRLGGDLQEMRKEAADLAIKDADKLGSSWNRDAEQPLDRERLRVLLIHRRDIVKAIEIGYVLQVGARLHELFGAAMQEADMRVDALAHLTIKLEHQAQHAMRSRMLRPEVDREVG